MTIYTPEQMESWRGVPKAMHVRGGKICMQLLRRLEEQIELTRGENNERQSKQYLTSHIADSAR